MSTDGTLLHAAGMQSWALYRRKQITCLRFFCLFVAQRATRQCRPLLQLKTNRFMLPARRWKRPLQLITFGGDANGSSSTTANKYLFADLLLFKSGEGDEATSPSLATVIESIDASSPLLEAPLHLITCGGGCKQEQFHYGKQILVCQSFVI